ncbi:hypothetical protein KGQ19_07610 [Catenulispora sp. NL8]|uniref:DUF8094 domain-containing protein n=1 Tax=Catenulispora pinistramenti TaxID=2705254 RepID=A0ABS5KL18_9ACTN|nr:hypothetical protein [Catenulispora pinistramenti]MBS2546731.1 hypothetical protein [Catenulispora pinistramenti]
MRDTVRGFSRSAAISAVLAATMAAAVACSTSGTVRAGGAAGGANPLTGTGSGPATSASGPAPTGQSLVSGRQGSPTTSASASDVTVTQGEAAAALGAYQSANNTVNAALDIPGEAKIESGSLLTLDQGSLLYYQGIGGAKAAQSKAPVTFADPVFYIARSIAYPRGFYVTANAVQPGLPDAGSLLHFTQEQAGAPWLVDTTLGLTAGRQWPAFAVGADGLLDYTATQLTRLPLDTTDLAVADRTLLTGDDAGTPGSPFVSDDVTTAERKWIQDDTSGVSPATVTLTVSTATDPLPTYLPLKDGGELAIYGTRLSLRATQAGRTFTFADQGWAKVAGAQTAEGGFTTDSVWMVAAVDPPEKSGKIQKIAYNGGLVSVEH